MKSSKIVKKIPFKSIALAFFGLLFLRGIFFSAFAQTAPNVNTYLRITTWVFSFQKDTGSTMGSYFSGAPCNWWTTTFTWNTWAGIDFGSTGISLASQSMYSSGNDRFTVSDMYWQSFTIQVLSTALTGYFAGSATPVIPATNITYTGSNWCGTGWVLTNSWAFNNNQSSALNANYTMAARVNNSWLSLWSQFVRLRVDIPAAQNGWGYTGMLIFTQT